MKTAREEILARLRKTEIPEPEKPDFEKPIYPPLNEPLESVFKQALELVNGKAYICRNEEACFELLKKTVSRFENIFCHEQTIQQLLTKYDINHSANQKLLENTEVGITGCEYLIAHTGSVMVSTTQIGGRQLFVYPPVHVVIAKKEQLVDYLEKAYEGIKTKYNKNMPSQITLITGPSRTADIEKTLTLGAHGPKELHVFIYS